MKTLRAALFVITVCLTFGCSHYSDITGKVVDSATGKPIEGAVVVAQWTKPRGWLGEQQRELHKIIETLTDREGKFFLSGTTGFVLDPPVMIIYKEGYISWRNDQIFPSCNKVKNNEWNNNVTYRLDVFDTKYSYEQYYQFLDSGIIGLNNTPIFDKIHNKVHSLKVDELRAKKGTKQ